MAIDDPTDPLSDMFTLFAAPLAGTIRSVEQFRKGVDEFLSGVENFNRTMENLNETSERINTLLAEVEEPIRAAVPQATRTIKAADDVMQIVSGPAMAAAPGLAKLAETLNSPAFAQLPNQIGQFSELLGDISNRLAPLNQLAESAGGLFGGLRLPGVPGPRPSTQPAPEAEAEPETETETETGIETGPVISATTTKRATIKKPTPKKSTVKKASAKKPAPKKSAATKSTVKKAPAAKRTAAKKSKS